MEERALSHQTLHELFVRRLRTQLVVEKAQVLEQVLMEKIIAALKDVPVGGRERLIQKAIEAATVTINDAQLRGNGNEVG